MPGHQSGPSSAVIMTASTLSLLGDIETESSGNGAFGADARLCAPDAAARVEDELTRSYARHYVRTWPTVLLLACMLFVAATLWASAEALAPGLLLIVGTVAVTSVACRHFLEPGHGGLSIPIWRRGFVISEFVQGFGWVLFAVPFFMDDQASSDPNAHSFMLVAVLIVMIA